MAFQDLSIPFISNAIVCEKKKRAPPPPRGGKITCQVHKSKIKKGSDIETDS